MNEESVKTSATNCFERFSLVEVLNSEAQETQPCVLSLISSETLGRTLVLLSLSFFTYEEMDDGKDLHSLFKAMISEDSMIKIMLGSK